MLRASISMVADPTASLDIALYYNDPASGWRAAGRVTGQQVELLNPSPGQYAVEIVAKSAPLGKTSFTYSLTEVKEGADVTVTDTATDRPFGSTWSVPVRVKVPNQFGNRLGAITLRDVNSGKVLAVVPIEVR